MQVKAEAELSAKSGSPTYSVSEDDRHVTWTITADQLEEFREWDHLSREERSARASASVEHSDERHSLHAIVARNALRRYLGIETFLSSELRPKSKSRDIRFVEITESPAWRIAVEIADRGDGSGRIGRRVVIAFGDSVDLFGPWMNDAQATALAAYLLPTSH